MPDRSYGLCNWEQCNLRHMLGAELLKREQQRDQCPKNAKSWDDSCHSEISGVKLKYLFMQYMDGFHYADRTGFPFFRYKKEERGKPSEEWRTGRMPCEDTGAPCDNPQDMEAHQLMPNQIVDNCANQTARACLAHFFSGSTERDILVFSFGMIPAIHMDDQSNPSIDYRKWLLASAGAFRGHLAATFKGQVFRTTLAEFHGQKKLAPKSPNMQLVNDILWDVWQPDSSELPWYTIDQWPINRGRHHLYDDEVHYNGPLTEAMLHQVLNELCPGGGKTPSSPLRPD